MNSEIYLDNSTLTKPSSHLVQEMTAHLDRYWHCVGSPYFKEKEPYYSLNSTVKVLYDFIGAHTKDQFIFTSCKDEAISHVFLSAYMDHLEDSGKNHILTTPIINGSIKNVGERIQKLGGVLKSIPYNENGEITVDHLKKFISPRTGMISITWSNPYTGVIHPILELAEFCDEQGILFHVDASTVLGKVYFRFQDIPIDYLTFEGSLIHGPKGSGGLFVNRFTRFQPMYSKSKEEKEFNIASLIGLGIAFEEMNHAFDQLCMETARLRNLLESGIINAIPEASILFQELERVPNVCAITFPKLHHELLAFHLCKKGVFVSSVINDSLQTNRMRAQEIGIESEVAVSTLSFSLSRDTNEEEVKNAIQIIVDSAQKCRTFSGENIS